MGLFSIIGDIFGKKEKGGDVVDTTPKWLRELGQTLGTQLQAGIKDYTPGTSYSGNLDFAGQPTGQENQGLAILQQMLSGSGTGDLFNSASQHITDTLSGKFADPTKSPFIASMQKVLKNQLADQITQERGSRGARGTYFTDAGVQAEGRLRERSVDSLNSIIGQFIQNERNNMLTASGQAADLDKYKNLTLPTARVAASQAYGGLTRLIQGANLESRYQDYLRQRKEQQSALSTAAGLKDVTDIGQVVTPKYTVNNDLGNIMSILTSFGNMAKDSGAGSVGSGGAGIGSLSSLITLIPQLLAAGA